MILKYKDSEHYGMFIPENGYLWPLYLENENDRLFIENLRKANEYNVAFIEPKFEPFLEEKIINKINENLDNYFDFNKAILDIGSFAGNYSFDTKFKYAYSFEPNIIMYHIVCINLIIHNKFINSKVFNTILSDKHEKLKYDGFSTLLNDQNKNPLYNNNDINDAQKIHYHTELISNFLDEYDLSNIGLIKIDVEGMEEKVLRGGLGTIVRNNYPPILFELWNVNHCGMTQEKHDSLQKFLEDIGYEIFWYWGDHETHLAIHK